MDGYLFAAKSYAVSFIEVEDNFLDHEFDVKWPPVEMLTEIFSFFVIDHQF